MKITPLRILIILTGFVLFLTFAVYSFKKEMSRPKLPELNFVRQFELTDSAGKTFNSGELKGKAWIADFFFTTCADVCPMMTKHMAQLSRTFEAVKGVHFVSISVNPEHDSPEVLSKYAQKLNVPLDQWHFLTGERETITKLMTEDFKIGSKEEPIFHSTFFVLVDRNSYIRGYYDGTQKPSIEKLFKDVARLLKERS